MPDDPFAAFKDVHRAMWATFAPMATFTSPAAANLVRFAGIASGETVLDVGTGTGVVAITAARAGARVSAIDLTPQLVAEAKENARVAGISGIDFLEGDAERLPYPDASFDVVVSQFGHMFAPQPERAIAEMRRVLKPSGRVAFSTWPPDRLVGQTFVLVGRNSPPLPPGAQPPVSWGDETVVSERLAGRFEDPTFERGIMNVPALSIAHYREFMERNIGPITRLVGNLSASPEQLAAFRREFDAIIEPYYSGNIVQQEYLMTRASAR